MSEKLGATIAGPLSGGADRLSKIDDEEKRREHEAFLHMRDVAVTMGKRWGIIRTQKATPKNVRPRKGKGRAAKAHEGSRPPTSVTGEAEDKLQFGRVDVGVDVIEPPYDLGVLCSFLENSSSLRQNVDAMVTNIDGFGHHFEPVIDFGDPEVENVVRDILFQNKLDHADDRVDDVMHLTPEQVEAATPTAEEVLRTKDLWEKLAKVEKGRIECFFKFINPLEPFVEVRRATREALEIMGNAGWEVIREDPGDPNSMISQVYHVPFCNMKLLRADKTPTEVEMRVKTDAVNFDTIKVQRYFRRYVRDAGGAKTFFKEFGDPRVISRLTGKIYASVQDLEKDEKDGQPANEFFHWRIKSQLSSYGVPRWIGALLAVLGSRAAEEVNFLYFDNKAIPPMVLLVSGGRVSEQAVERLESYIEDRIKGRQNFHKIMVIEGLPADADASEGDIEASGKLRLELKPLLGDQLQDALFQEYDQNNIRKIGRSFRQPQLLTGDTKDMNRSTAEVAKAFAEEQIYQPARSHFDDLMNRHFLTNRLIHFWNFTTNAPVQRIPNDLVDNVKKSLESGAITPNEGRKLLSDAFSLDFPYRRDDWADIPPSLAVQAARAGALPGAESGGESLVDEDFEDAEPVEGEGEGEGEGITIASIAAKRRKRRALAFGSFLAEFRQIVREEAQAEMDSFFDPGRADRDE